MSQPPAYPGSGEPGYPSQPQQSQGYHQATPEYGQVKPGRNPLGLASLVIGALGPLLGVLFLAIQAFLVGVQDVRAFSALSTVNAVVSGLVAVVAVVLAVVALNRRGLSKTLAAAGLALGVAGLVGVLGGLLYTAIVSVMY